jgi:mediator of replication checkpoint protein 1
MEAYDTDEDDEDYAPEERGSASPEPTNSDGEGGSDQENQPTDFGVNDDASQQTEPEDEKLLVRRRGIRRPRMVASDDEDDIPGILVPNSSVLDLESAINSVVVTRNSESDQTEDENDKENSQTLMYDRSEDKENKAVVRHSPSAARPPLGSRPGSLLDIEDGVHGRVSPSSSLGGFNAASNSPKQNLRTPLKEIAEEDDLLLSQPPFTARLLQSTSKYPSSPPQASTSQVNLDSPPALRPIPLGRLESSFSDIEDENVDKGFGSRGLLPSFSETLIQRPASFVPLDPLANGGGFSKFFSDEIVCGLLRCK